MLTLLVNPALDGKGLNLNPISRIGQPAPFEITLPYSDYDFSRRLFKLNHDWGIPTEKEVNFIAGYLNHARSKILDLACGGGRHALALARMGHEVIGIDIGGYPIRIATRLAQRGNLQAKFLRRDIRGIEYLQEFDLAFLICGQLAHFSPEESKIIFSKASAALKSNGIFVVHINRFSPDDRTNLQRWFQEYKPLYMKHPSLVHREQYYFADDRVKLLRDFAIDSVTQENRLFGISEKEYTSEEIGKIAAGADLRLSESFGCYGKSALNRGSENMILVFQKKR